MDLLIKMLRDSIPLSPSQKWKYEVDVSHSCFQMEHTSIQKAIFSGMGHEKEDEIMILIVIRFFVGKSHVPHHATLKEKGIEAAIQALFQFPDTHAICTECGLTRSSENGRAQCESCLFLEVFSDKKGPKAVCSICHEPAFRTMLPCGHVFHMTCLLQMDRHGLKCPNCRSALPSEMKRAFFGGCHCGDDDFSDDDDEDDDLDDQDDD